MRCCDITPSCSPQQNPPWQTSGSTAVCSQGWLPMGTWSGWNLSFSFLFYWLLADKRHCAISKSPIPHIVMFLRWLVYHGRLCFSDGWCIMVGCVSQMAGVSWSSLWMLSGVFSRRGQDFRTERVKLVWVAFSNTKQVQNKKSGTSRGLNYNLRCLKSSFFKNI